MGGVTSGLDVSTDVLGVMSGNFGVIARNREAAAETQALKGRELQEQIEAINQKEQRARQLERVTSAATAEQAARGLSLGSGSFKAIESKSFDDFASDENIIDMNTKFQTDALNQKISNINKVKNFQDINTIVQSGVKVAEVIAGLPPVGIPGAQALSPGSGESPVSKVSSESPGFDQQNSELLQNAFGNFDKKQFPDAFSYDPNDISRF